MPQHWNQHGDNYILSSYCKRRKKLHICNTPSLVYPLYVLFRETVQQTPTIWPFPPRSVLGVFLKHNLSTETHLYSTKIIHILSIKNWAPCSSFLCHLFNHPTAMFTFTPTDPPFLFAHQFKTKLVTQSFRLIVHVHWKHNAAHMTCTCLFTLLYKMILFSFYLWPACQVKEG